MVKNLNEIYLAGQPPVLPAKLPKLMEDVTCNTPEKFKPTLSQMVKPVFMSYSRDVRFKYIDNQPRELRGASVCVAETGEGKDISLKQPMKYILQPMKNDDAPARARLQEYENLANRRSSNKELPERPKDLVIQCLSPDLTRAALYLRMQDSQGWPLFCRMSEIEQWDKVEQSSGAANQFTVMKLADDEDNEFGAERATANGVTATGCLKLNWIANTTIQKALKYFKYVMSEGPISRLTLATVPTSELGEPIPVFGNYGDDYAARLQPYIDNLRAATGLHTCQEAIDMTNRLKKECDDFAILSQDRVFNNLSHRALVHAFRTGCMIYTANGFQWEDTIEEFCRWSLHYDLWLKLHIFGDALRSAQAGETLTKKGPKSLLAEITSADKKQFTVSDLLKLRLSNGMSNQFDREKAEKATKNLIYKWVQRGLVKHVEGDCYEAIAR